MLGSQKYQPTNHDNYYGSREFINTLVEKITTKLGRPLQKNETIYISNVIRDINPNVFYGIEKNKVINAITNKIVEDIARVRCGKEERYDVHEMLKEKIKSQDGETNQYATSQSITSGVMSALAGEVNVLNFLGLRTQTELRNLINPAQSKKYIYLNFDSRYRSLDNDGRNFLRWNYINNEITQQGTTNSIGDVRDITRLRIYPVNIPYVQSAVTEYNRITIYIQEFAAQSFIAHENRRFHFMFNTTVYDRRIELEPERNNDGYFNFRTPLTRLDTLTFTFASPYEPVVFDQDRSVLSVVSYGTTTEFSVPSNHNLETGDRVYITNFTTLNPNTDNNIVSQINRTSGHYIVASGATGIIIDVDTSTIVVAGAGTISYTSGSSIITGTGTAFTPLFNLNDYINILGTQYRVASIQSATQLTLSSAINITGAGVAYSRDNRVLNIAPSVFYGAKRIIMNMEIEYIGIN
jgi:hypothetical protein